MFHELTEEANDYWIDLKEMHLITDFVYEKWAMTNTHLTTARDEMYQAAGLESIQHSVTWTSIAAKCDEHQVYAHSSELWARAVECANVTTTNLSGQLVNAVVRLNWLPKHLNLLMS